MLVLVTKLARWTIVNKLSSTTSKWSSHCTWQVRLHRLKNNSNSDTTFPSNGVRHVATSAPKHGASDASSARYDYIIVGAGSAGCVLANRLSAASDDIRVLLLEAGPSDKMINVRMPGGVTRVVHDKRYSFHFETMPQTDANGRRLFIPRGRMLGGCSSHNYMAYVRGHPYDYDRWAKDEGAVGWSFAECLPYFKRAQTHELGPNEYRGGDGPLYVAPGKANNVLYKTFIRAGQQAGYQLNDDFNGFRQEGFGQYNMTIRDGKRYGTSKAYLSPARKRRQLSVITEAIGAKVVFDGKRAVGVEYMQDGSGSNQPYRATATREVIISAGAINSPQILMLSGIGGADHLRTHGIPVVAQRQGVGENLHDHPMAITIQACSQPVSEYYTPMKTLLNTLQWRIFSTGVLASPHNEGGAFIRSRDAPDVQQPDIQMHFLPFQFLEHVRKPPERHAFSIAAVVLRPTSRGTVRLQSSNPTVAPLIDPRCLQTERDRVDLRVGVQLARKVIAQKAFDPYRGSELTPGPNVRSDVEIDAWVRANVEFIYHPVGSCRMGSADDPLAVVDPQCRVIGVDGLRVVDASVMPSIVSGNTNAPTIMIAEKAADMILGRDPLPRLSVPVWNSALVAKK